MVQHRGAHPLSAVLRRAPRGSAPPADASARALHAGHGAQAADARLPAARRPLAAPAAGAVAEDRGTGRHHAPAARPPGLMIDVVIPVYGGVQQTRRCVESVLACTPRVEAEVVVVNDASPEPAIASYVAQLADEGRITLLTNEENRGFVQSVNRGMALHADRDVVLLNSDTEVANDWLERLRSAAHRHPDVATVTPFSNNATICSYPFEGWSAALPGMLGLAALDRLFARTNTGLTVELPTAVGFCMYIRRDALQALGAFDAERFGRGYGEENDFCMRALKAGWRNLL